MSAIIKVFHDPQGLNRDRPCVVNRGTDLNDWLLNKFGPDGFSLPTVIYLNGIAEANEIYRTDSTPDVWDLPTRGCVLRDDDIVVIVHSPLGLTAWGIAGIVALSVGTTALGYYAATSAIDTNIEVPEPPEPDSMVAPDSKNNALTAQSNLARPNGRIPDIYGRNRVYPDLLARSYHEWTANKMTLTQIFSIGRGFFNLSNWKNADTPLTSGEYGFDITVLDPGDSPPTDLKNVTPVTSVKGQELFAPNAPVGVGDFLMNTTHQGDSTYKFECLHSTLLDIFDDADTDARVYISGPDQPQKEVLSMEVSFGVGGIDYITLVDEPSYINRDIKVGTFLRIQNTANYSNQYVVIEIPNNPNPRFRVATTIGNPVTFPSSETDLYARVTAWHPLDVGNPSYPTGLEWNFDRLTPFGNKDHLFLKPTGPAGAFVSGTVEDRLTISLANSPLSVIGKFSIPEGSTEVWFEFQFPRGLGRADDNGDPLGVQVQVDIIFYSGEFSAGATSDIKAGERRITRTYANNSRNACSYTEKIDVSTLDAGYDVSTADLTVACYRVTDIDLEDSTLRDEMRWMQLLGVKALDCSGHSGVTWAYAKTQSTSLSSGDSEVNVMAQRKLYTYDALGVQSTNMSETSKFMDAFIHEATDDNLGGKDISNIDVKGIYAEQAAMDSIDTDLGRFCYSFSDASVPVMSELQTMATTARGFLTRKGDIISFTFDRKQDQPLTLFNRRNKKPGSEHKKISFHKPADFQSVELTYVDEDTNDPIVIGVPSSESSRTSPLRINAAGIKNEYQATNRALYEYYRLIHQRTTVTTTVTNDGLLVELNDRISNSDGTDAAAQDFEILAWETIDDNKIRVETSEPIHFSSTYGYGILRSLNGDILLNNTTPPSLFHSVLPDGDPDDFGYTTSVKIFNIEPDRETFAERGSDYQSAATYKTPLFQKGSILTFYDSESGDINAMAKKDDYVIKAIAPSDDGYVNLEMVNYTDAIFAGDIANPVIPT